MNYYELFDLPMLPFVDSSKLARKYFELQKKYHPDFFSQEDSNQKDNAEEMSAAINIAFNIFKDKQRTIEYFLKEKGILQNDHQHPLPPDFLMEMMELNESIDENGPDALSNATTYSESLDASIDSILAKQAECTSQELAQLQDYYYKKKYLQRILDRLAD
jgi:molecular chaperone HscB